MSDQPSQDARLAAWLQSLGPGGGGDTLVHFVPSSSNSVDLTHAHPSGLAQLLAGRRTRLSTLLRDPVQYAEARRTARVIAAKIDEVASQRGIDVGYLASGLVTWRSLRQGGSDYHSAPIMLGRISMERRSGVDDEEIQLIARCAPNPALLRLLQHHFGVSLDANALTESAYMMSRFDPAGPLAALREACRDIPGLVVADRLVVSTFADVADPADPAVVSPSHPVIAALMDAVGDSTVHASRRRARRLLPMPAEDIDADVRSDAGVGRGSAASEGDGSDGEAPVPGAEPAHEAEGRGPAGAADDETAIRMLPPLDDEVVGAETSDGGAETADGGAEPSDGGAETSAAEGNDGETNAGAPDAETAPARGDAAASAHPGRPSPGSAWIPRTLRDDVMTLGADLRDPAEELLVLEADEAQYDALNLVRQGRSVSVSAPPGTGGTTFAANAAVSLAAQGKRVLVVAEREDAVTAFLEALGSADLETLALPLRRDVDAEELRRRLTNAVLRNERAQEVHTEANEAVLRDRRSELSEHVRSLQSVRQRWNASPLQAMRELARVTSREPAPATTVRLKRSVLDAMPDRAPVTAKLQRLADVGAFDEQARRSPWFGAGLRHRGEADQALELVRSLAKDVPPLRKRLEDTAEATRIKPVKTFGQWGRTLRLLVDVRHSLDQFQPDIFDKAVDDLIAATASPQWRRERGIEMSSMTRSRLRKVAKEYVRGGVHVSDLHTSLVQVQAQRKAWETLATDKRYPSVPSGLEDVLRSYREVTERLTRLEKILPGQDTDGSLTRLALPQLTERLEALAEAEADLQPVPERTLLLEELRAQGLGELLDDFTERGVSREAIPDEVDQAWWQSVLEAMVSGDDFLALQDGASLERIQHEFARADARALQLGAERVKARLASGWRGALADHRVAARDLRALLKIGDPSVAHLAGIAPALMASLVPVWIGAPLYLPTVLPRWSRFDAVILLDAESMALVSALGAVGRAEQVIAVGDPGSGSPSPLAVSVDPVEASRPRPESPSAYETLAKVTPLRRLGTVHRVADERMVAAQPTPDGLGLASAPLAPGQGVAAVVHVDEGRARAGHGAAESTLEEVAAVVELVLAQATEHPERSLAVIAANRAHATAVAKALAKALPAHPEAAAVLARTDEPFVVTTAERASGLRRDAAVFTLGYGRTAHGMPVHDLGVLSAEGGQRALAASLGVGRRWMRIVSAVRPTEVDRTRLANGAGVLMDVMTALEAEPGGVDESYANDPLMGDLVERVRATGLRAVPGYAPGVDLAVFAPEGSERSPVAVSWDGSGWYSGTSVRERSRVLPQSLAQRGWLPLHVWAIDVFSDPSAVAARIAKAVGVVDAQAQGGPVDARSEPEGDADATREG